MIEIKHDAGDVDKLVNNLKSMNIEVNKVMVRSIKRTAKETRTFMAREVTKDYHVAYGAVLKELDITNPTWNRVEGRIYGSGSPGLPLFQFVRGGKKAPSTKRLKSGAYRPIGGKSVKIKKSGGQKVSSGLFLAKMKSGHIGAFKREGEKRLGISEKYGPSPIKLLAADKYRDDVDNFAADSLRKNTFHEADRVLQKMGLK